MEVPPPVRGTVQEHRNAFLSMWFSLALFKLTLQGVAADIPHDMAAWITYALLILFLVFLWSGTRTNA